jgi:hypothetical protein
MKILISSGLRVGSTWVMNMVTDLMRYNVYYFIDPDITSDVAYEKYERAVNILKRSDSDRVFKSHAISACEFTDLLSDIEDLKIINIHRNYPDAIASRFYYDRYHNKTQNNILHKFFGDRLSAINDKDAADEIIKEGTMLSRWINSLDMLRYTDTHPRVLCLSYERLASGDIEEFKKIFRFLNIPAAEERVRRLMSTHSFAVYQQREIERFQRSGSELFNRSGKIGEGVKLFTLDQINETRKKFRIKPNVHLNTLKFKRAVGSIFKHNEVKCIIECGTNDGTGSTALFSKYGVPVHTCEVSGIMYNRAVENLKHLPHVHCNHAFTTRRDDVDIVCIEQMINNKSIPEEENWLTSTFESEFKNLKSNEALIVFLDTHWTMGFIEFRKIFDYWYLNKPLNNKIIMILDDATNLKHQPSILYLREKGFGDSILQQERWAIIEFN